MNLRRCLFSGVILSIMLISCLSTAQYQDTRGSVFVDASVYLLYLPSLMSTVGLENLGTATQVFLQSNFEFFPTPVADIRVIVSSQALDGRKAFGDNSTYFVVQANIQVLVHSQGNNGNLNQQLIEDKILTHFTEDWTELSAMLKLLDPQFFENLKYIELKSSTMDYFPQLGNTQESESPSSLPENVILILLALGVGIVVASFTLLIPFCLAWYRCKRGSARETIASSFGSEGSVPAERPSKAKVSKTTKQQQQDKIASKTPSNDHSSPVESPLQKAPSEIFVSDCGHSTGQIQRIFSTDKVCLVEQASHRHSSSSTHHSFSIRDLRAQKHSAEDNFRESLRGIIRQTLSEVDLESGQRVQYITNVHRASTPLTERDSSDHECSRDRRKKVEVQKTSTSTHHSNKRHPSSQSSKGRKRSTSKNPTTVSIEPTGRTRQTPKGDDGVSPSNKQSNKEQSSVASSPLDEKFQPVISLTNDHDGSSISTITGSSSLFSAGPIQYELSSDEPVGSSQQDKLATQRERTEEDEDDTDTTMSYDLGLSDADDFGSIAHSLPSYQRNAMEYLEDV